MGKIPKHIPCDIHPVIRNQTDHREITVPVINFLETAARNNIGIGKRDSRCILIQGIRAPAEDIPHGAYMGIHVPAHVRLKRGGSAPRIRKMFMDKILKIKSDPFPFLQVHPFQFPEGTVPGQVHKSLGILKHPCELHIPE